MRGIPEIGRLGDFEDWGVGTVRKCRQTACNAYAKFIAAPLC